MKIYRAYYDSRNFTFEAFSKSKGIAYLKCLEALNLHTKEYSLDPTWFNFNLSDNGIEINSFELDTPYRDRETITRKENKL